MSQQQEADQRLLNYAGIISLGHATGVENENIDIELGDQEALELLRSRIIEQEVLDLIDEPETNRKINYPRILKNFRLFLSFKNK